MAAAPDPPAASEGGTHRNKGSDADRAPARWSGGQSAPSRRSIEAHAIDPHGLVDVLDALLAEALEPDGELVPHLVVGAAGDNDAAGIGQALEPVRDVDA